MSRQPEKKASPRASLRGPRRAALVLMLLLLGLGCDQATKRLAVDRLDVVQPVTMLGEVVQLQYTENAGSFLSLGASWPPAVRTAVLTGAVGAVLVAALAYTLLARRLVLLEVVGLALLVGGGLGNVLDRAFRGGVVVDFVSLGAGRLRTGVFNVADLLIEAGVVLLLLGWWKSSRPEREEASET